MGTVLYVEGVLIYYIQCCVKVNDSHLCKE